MYRIWKHHRFAASHVLSGLVEGHQCGRLHGHNYLIEIELSSPNLNEIGFVKDFGELKEFKNFIDTEWDHRHLNDVLDFNPTAENMAKYLYEKFNALWAEVTAVRVQETETSWAEYRA
jgi:6-pyruvoyltetrahydropterin/6-carboxytetrahydropterin synthase